MIGVFVCVCEPSRKSQTKKHGIRMVEKMLLKAKLCVLLLSSSSLANGQSGQQCGSYVCQNNSTCVNGAANFADHVLPSGGTLDVHQGDSNYHCACPTGWTGYACDVPFESCAGSTHKCYHGGKCVLGLIDMYNNEQMFCNCDDATDSQGSLYAGKYCETKALEYCDSKDDNFFCTNHGICNQAYPAQGPPCICDDIPNFEGPHCEYVKDTVPDCTLDCQNGGNCVLGTPDPQDYDKYDNYFGIFAQANKTKSYCRCPPGFYGYYCEIKSEVCGPDLCFHGSKCITSYVNGHQLHHCDCRFSNTGPKSYAGRFCQFEANQYCNKDAEQSTMLNGHLFCVNGGQCQDDVYLGCKCPQGYRGFSCEYYIKEDLNSDTVVSTYDKPADPVTEATCTLDCNGRGKCKDGIKDMQADDVGYATHLSNSSALSSQNYEHCVCEDGWTGLQCEHKAEECANGNFTCFHGSRCYTVKGKQQCDCSTANDTALGTIFGGAQCQHPATEICTVNPTSGSGLSFCVNQGTCKAKVGPGEPHPGCNCNETDWTGPHCEVKVIHQQASFFVGQSNSGWAAAAKFFTILFVIIILGIVFYAVSRYYKFRKPKGVERISSSRPSFHLRKRSGGSYSDGLVQTNLSPRRSMDSDHAVGTASSRDPFAAHLMVPLVLGRPAVQSSKLSPNITKPLVPKSDQSSLMDREEGPIYLGPPKDEDGHVLHSVEII